MKSLTFPTHANSDVIETAYRTWLENPESIDPTWRAEQLSVAEFAALARAWERQRA